MSSMRTYLLLAVLPLLSLPAHGAVTFKNADFEIALGSDWTRTALVGVDHFYFQSIERMVSVKIDSVRYAKITPDRFEQAARALIETGIKNESDENPAGPVTITSQTVTRTANGAKATYAGHDARRSFKFVGFVQQGKAVYLLFETPVRYENRLEPVIDEVLGGFKPRP